MLVGVIGRGITVKFDKYIDTVPTNPAEIYLLKTNDTNVIQIFASANRRKWTEEISHVV